MRCIAGARVRARLQLAICSAATPRARRWRRSASTSGRVFSAGSARTRYPRASAPDSENAAVIAVPGEHRCGSAVRPPGLGHLTELLFARLVLEPHQSSELDEHGKIACRKYVRPAFREKQVDFRRP